MTESAQNYETDADDEGTEDERQNAKKRFVPPKKQSLPNPKENVPTPKPHAPRSFVHQEVTPIQKSPYGVNPSKSVQPEIKAEPRVATKTEPTVQTKIEPKGNIFDTEVDCYVTGTKNNVFVFLH